MSKRRPLAFSFILVVTLLSRSPAGQEMTRYSGPIIDMHMHATAPEAPLRPSGCQPRPCADLLPPPNAKGVLQETLGAMDRHNIVLGFLSGQRVDDLYQWIEAAPGRFIPSASVIDVEQVDPMRLRRDYEAGRLRGMGEIGTVYRGVAPDDPRLAPYFLLAAEFDVPLLIHLGGLGAPVPTFRIAAGHPERLEEVLRRHQQLRVFLENAGFPFLDATIALMYTFPNVYADLSTIT